MAENNYLYAQKVEILDTKPLSELVSEATVKVCWVSDTIPNANGTLITEAVGREIAATLPGAPVVGYYDEKTQDFEQHSRNIKFDKGEIVFEDITKPYGFVSPLTQPWFTDIVDDDGITHKWLLCKVFLWTRQYKEAGQVIGKGQSMELDQNNIAGFKRGEIFIFTTAATDKLCILGNEYPPCFDGAGFLTQFSKQYISMAEQLENIIGRRYYAMNGKLVDKKSSVALSYALELGWPLTDAIHAQLSERGMANYDVEGVYFEGGSIFTVVRNRETTELNRINLIIYNDQTIELEATMTAVEQTWTAVQAPAQTPTEPLNGSAAPEQDIPMNVAATYSSEPAAEPAAEPATEPATEPTPAPVATATPAEAPAAVAEPVAAVPATEPVTDFSEEVIALRAENASLKEQLASYAKIAAEQLTADKKALVAEYAQLIKDEETQEKFFGIEQTISDPAITLADAEATIAIAYGKIAKEQKQAAEAESKPDLTFNLNSGDKPEELPDFLVKALAYDEGRKINLG